MEQITTLVEDVETFWGLVAVLAVLVLGYFVGLQLIFRIEEKKSDRDGITDLNDLRDRERER